MTCEQIQQYLTTYFSRELSQAQRIRIENHVEDCTRCSAELHETRQAWQALEDWNDEPVPMDLALSITKKAHAAVTPEVSSSTTGKVFKWWHPGASGSIPVMPLGLGLAAAFLTAVIIGTRSDYELLHPFALIAAGALWVVMYGLIFSLFSIGQKSGHTRWKFLAQAALVAGGMFLLLTYVSPVPDSITFCSSYYLTQPFIERLSIGGSYFLFGGLYALIPMGIAAFFSVHRKEKSPLLHGSIAGGLFALLLAPGIIMQCAPFALGVLLGWFGGALVGSIIGGALGYWLRLKLA
jgi:hypothetical protein